MSRSASLLSRHAITRLDRPANDRTGSPLPVHTLPESKKFLVLSGSQNVDPVTHDGSLNDFSHFNSHNIVAHWMDHPGNQELRRPALIKNSTESGRNP